MSSGMKSRYARQPKRKARKGLFLTGLSWLGSAIARNPVSFGGSTAFLVTLAVVSVNAVWKQPQVHPNAFIATRAPARPVKPVPTPTPAPTEVRSEVPPRVDHPAPAVAPVENGSTGSIAPLSGNSNVAAVQQVLHDLGLYQGPVDGLTGPQTRTAVQNYRRIVGLPAGSDIDDALLVQLGLKRPAAEASVSEPVRIEQVSLGAGSAGNDSVKKVQAALRAFGHTEIEVDGILGKGTREAIREFQSLFGLPVTGEVDRELLAKMREIGLAD